MTEVRPPASVGKGALSPSLDSCSTGRSSRLDGEAVGGGTGESLEFSQCGKGSLVGVDGWGNHRVVPLMCKRWECEVCGARRTKEWEKRIARAVNYWVEQGMRARFLTLSLVRKIADAREAFLEATKVMQRYEKRMRRRGYEWRYVACLDVGTKTGRPHLHVIELGKRYLPQKLISAQWAASGGGAVVDVRKVFGVRGAVRDLAKYLMKGRFVRLDGVRRVRASRDFFKVEAGDHQPADDDDDVWAWRYSSASVSDWVAMWSGAVASGRAVMWRAGGGAVFRLVGEPGGS